MTANDARLVQFQAVFCAITTGHGLTRRCSVGERGVEGGEPGQYCPPLSAFHPPNGTCLDTSEATGEVNRIAREMA